MTLIDTAEMYGDGGAEKIVARAIAGRRDDVFVVSKVYPHNASAAGHDRRVRAQPRAARAPTVSISICCTGAAAFRSAETVDAFERLRAHGKIVRWGVSNFDVEDMRELLALPDGARCATNQVLYNIAERGIEWELRALCHRHGMPVMAYSPFGQGALLRERKLAKLAATHALTPARLAIAWLLAQTDVIAIPQSSNRAHVAECRAAADVRLPAEVLAEIDAAFPPPRRARPLAML